MPSIPAAAASRAKRSEPWRRMGLAYVITTKGTWDSRRNPRTSSSTSATPTPAPTAHSEARWISGPSAIGSENGTPSSMAHAPARAKRCISSSEAVSEG